MDPWLMVAPAGMEVVSKLLLSIRDGLERLLGEIQSPNESQRLKVIPGDKVAAELQDLQVPMLRILHILLSADPRSLPDYKALHLQARDAAFCLEDLMDTIDYRRLQLELELASPTKFSVSPLLYSYIHLKRLILCPGISSLKPDKIIRVVAQDASKLVHLLEKGSALSSEPLLDSPDSSSGAQPVLPKGTVFGRDKERQEILKMLMEPCHDPELKVINISGLGGVGKTTLAQLAYNDASVDAHFDIKSWVFVSLCFDGLELAAEILRSAEPAWMGSPDKMADPQTLKSELRQLVACKRCLIVLDDLWDEAAWQDILNPLQSSGSGSKILVTSRTNMVPSVQAESQVYPISPLGIDNSWALFKEHAFPSNNNDEHPALKSIGRQIAARIHGLPLAAKVVGKVLEATRNKEQWKNILSKLIQDDSVLTALHLGYSHLPGHLKRCFAYCSLFPKNRKLDATHLIRLWVAEGFVQPQCRAGERLEDRASEYFDQLLSRSLFQERKLGSKIYYLMPNLIHDIAESVSAKDYFHIGQTANWDIPLTVRHLSVTMNNLRGLASFCNLDKLRTLLVLSSLPFSSNWFEKDLLEKSRNLHVLDLSGCILTELPQSIGNLLHLRYLSVHDTIQRLPDSIGKLLHLQYLCFSENCSIKKLPASVNMLVSLRHLGMATKHTAALVGIRRLVNLQGSLELHVEKLEGRSLEELRNINGLRGLLKIRGLENVSSKGEACTAELNKKRNLNSLFLEWSSAHRKLHPPSDAEVLEGLLPHQDLRDLCIRRYCGTEAPSWLQLPLLQHLQSLRLINCRGLAVLPALGHLRSLRTLHMRELCAVDRIGHEFYGTDHVAFPSLCFLEFDDFPKLREWHGIPNRKSFPCLERLKLMDCPKLTQIPSLPPTTIEVTIERTQLLPYMRLFPSSSSLELLQLDIRTSSVLFKDLLHEDHIRSITTLNISGAEQLVATKELGSLVSLQRLQLSQCGFTDQTFSEFLQALPCLSSLEIIDLHKITSLPVLEKLKSCTKLKDLRIRNCHLLRSLSSLQFFDSLRCLVIERCPELTATSFPVNFANLSSLKVLRISYCPELQYLPVSGLQSSLETLHLVGCHPELSRKIKTHERPLRSFALYPKSLV